MGIDRAPFWANIYLSKNKCDFMSKLIKKDFVRANSFMELSHLLMISVQSMIELNLKSHTKKFTPRNWNESWNILDLSLTFLI